MSQPRNLVASYVVGRSEGSAAEQGRAVAAISNYEAVVGTPPGWLLAVEPAPLGGQRHFADDQGASLEASSQLARLSAQQRRSLLRSGAELAALPGEFACCMLGVDGAVDVVRSCGGRVPIYYRVTSSSICVATRLRDLYWLCPDELQPDLLVHALWGAGNAIFPDERTFFRDVKILPKGHVLNASPGRQKVTRYWEPRRTALPEPDAEQQATHARQLHDILVGCLDAELSKSEPNLLTLSGGVDSSSVAVLAARTLKRPLTTLTFVAPRASRARPVQLSFVEPLLDELAVYSRHLIEADNERLDAIFATPLVTLCYCPHPALRVLPELGSSRYGSLVSGHFADELCGYSQRLQDWVRHTRLVSLLTTRSPYRYGLRDGMRWAKRRLLNALGRELLPLPAPLGRVFATELRQELDDWRTDTRARMLADVRSLRELAAWVELDGWIAMHWEVGSVLGVKPIHPFFNRAALELGFGCHPVELFGPGPKKLLRRALQGVVPERYLHRQDKGHWHRPPRLERMAFRRDLGELGGCTAQHTLASAGGLSVIEHRQLTQLGLFAQALREERDRRRSLWPAAT